MQDSKSAWRTLTFLGRYASIDAPDVIEGPTNGTVLAYVEK